MKLYTKNKKTKKQIKTGQKPLNLTGIKNKQIRSCWIAYANYKNLTYK